MSVVNNSAGINVTGSKLQLVEIAVKGSDIFLENADEAAFENVISPGITDIEFTTALQSAFEKIINRKKPDFNSVSFSLPSGFFRYFHLPLEKKLLGKELQEHISWEFSVLFPGESRDGYIVNSISFNNNPDNVFIVCIKKSVVKSISGFCSKNNLRLRFVDMADLTVHNYLAKISETENKSCVSLYISANSVSAAFIRDREVEKLRIFPIKNSTVPVERLKELFSVYEDYAGADNVDYFISGDDLKPSGVMEYNSLLNKSFKNILPFGNIKKSNLTSHLESEEATLRYFVPVSLAIRIA